MATELALQYTGHATKTRPSALLNSIFMTTVNTAAKTLVAVASKTKADHVDRWRPADHMRYMFMLMTWTAVWFLRVLMDHLPTSLVGPYSSSYLLQGYSSATAGGSFDFPPLPSSALTPSSSLDLVLHDGSDGPSAQGLGRSLTHIFALLNEMPASSRKYQFAVAMADKIVEENTRNGHSELMQINRVALSSAFARTLHLLYSSLRTAGGGQLGDDYFSGPRAWASRAIRALPMGTLLYPYVRGLGVFMGTIYSAVVAGGAEVAKDRRRAGRREDSMEVLAEKYAQELTWITKKMMMCGAVDEAVVQWSLASGLASLSLTASPRVQGSIVKLSCILIGELTRGGVELPGQVKYRLLVLWLPLLCHAENGLSYPVLTGYEKIETERTIDQVIATLPSAEQEVVLANWLQDFSSTSSDWPNLQASYDCWCRSSRIVLIEEDE